jgi:cytoskeleton protein RodZ
MGSLGAWLRAQREARGVSLQEIAESSKISLRHLEALERDRFDQLPAPVFVRGFLREYGRIVGLDSDEVVNVYLLALEAARPEADAVRADAAAAPAPRRSRTAARGALAALAVALVLTAAASLAWYFGRPAKSPPAPARPAASTPAPAPPSADEPRAETGSSADEPGPAGAGSEAQPLPGAPADSPAPPAPWPLGEPQPRDAAPSAPETPQPLRVVLEFQQDCWVEVVVDGRRRESELKAGGETWAIEATDSVVLTLGNAPAVRVEVDGRPLELPLAGTRVVRDFRIDRTGIAPASPADGPART